MAQETNTKLAIEQSQYYINILLETGYKISQSYLFGSYAKGNATNDSDIDLAIILSTSEIDNYDERVKLMKIAVKNNYYLIEPHPFSEKDFDEEDPLIKEIKRTGIKIV
jgi:uncharacterized protein